MTIISLFTGRSNNSVGGGLAGFYGREGELSRPARWLGGVYGCERALHGPVRELGGLGG
jgi:hypothetical protein